MHTDLPGCLSITTCWLLLAHLTTTAYDNCVFRCEGVSTLLQVLVSIQALIFTDEPHYNEPGTEVRPESVSCFRLIAHWQPICMYS